MRAGARPERSVRPTSARSVLGDGLVYGTQGGTSRAALGLTLVAAVVGLVSWATGFGLVALWAFVAASIGAAFVLPLPLALVAPLYMGVLGWLVDMLPFVTLTGWAAVVLRWGLSLARERRLPRGGRFVWIPVGLVVVTALGAAVISASDVKHFLLLFGLQVLSSGVVLLAMDCLGELGARRQVAAGLVAFTLLLTAGVVVEWTGVPLQSLQDKRVSDLVEAAYGVDAFENDVGMIKDERSSRGGALELQRRLEVLRRGNPDMPRALVFQPRFRAFPRRLLVRFDGSARPWEAELEQLDVELAYDNLGFGPANTVARMRSFPRNANTYAGIGAVLLPFAFYLVWTSSGRSRLLWWSSAAACLFGIGFSLTRGAWLAVVIGAAFLVVAGFLSWGRKLQIVAALVAGAVFLTGFYYIKYDVDPLNARAEAQGSVNTRRRLYGETLSSVGGINYLIGYGTEKARTKSGVSHALGRYIPRAGTHSTYLNFLFRTGIPGAVLIVALYGFAALASLAGARARRGDDRVFCTLCTAAVLAAASHAVVLSLFVEPVYTLTVSIVLGVALTTLADRSVPLLGWRSPPPPRRV